MPLLQSNEMELPSKVIIVISEYLTIFQLPSFCLHQEILKQEKTGQGKSLVMLSFAMS